MGFFPTALLEDKTVSGGATERRLKTICIGVGQGIAMVVEKPA